MESNKGNKRGTIDQYFKPINKKPTTTSTVLTEEIVPINEIVKETNGNEEAHLTPTISSIFNLEKETMEKGWLKVLSPEFEKPYFKKLKDFLAKEKSEKKVIFPPETEIYSWSTLTPLNKVKVIIIGQDPYHNTNQAHGLCFSVVKGVRPPPSLVNIYKELKKEYPEFVIPNHGYLAEWAKQGVLMLNASLTVQAHKPNSHEGQGWDFFTDAVIQHLSDNSQNLVFILWGNFAQKKGIRINSKKHLVLKGVHPSPFSANKGFFGCDHFKKANAYLKEHGKAQIDWCKLD